MEQRDALLRIFSVKIREAMSKLVINYDHLQEVRLRIQSPMIVVYENKEYFVTTDSKLVHDMRHAYIVTKNEIRETMEYISNYSLYAFEDEIRQGFITVQGGHRIGLAGKMIMENEIVKSMKHITFINVRLSHQVKGCADSIMKYLYNEKTKDVLHTLIISPPRCGKTTILRDIIRQISDGTKQYSGMPIGVVDERSEIGACYLGVPQNDLGMRTDILDCCPKAIGMMMLIRSMSPRVIAVDEIGSRDDLEAMEYVVNSGCKLIATIHGSDLEDIKKKPLIKQFVNEGVFERYMVLSNRRGVGTIEQIYNAKGEMLCLH